MKQMSFDIDKIVVASIAASYYLARAIDSFRGLVDQTQLRLLNGFKSDLSISKRYE